MEGESLATGPSFDLTWDSAQVLGGDTSLFAGAQLDCLINNPGGIVVETVSVAVWADHHLGGHNGVATFAHFVSDRIVRNFPRLRETILLGDVGHGATQTQKKKGHEKNSP